MHRVFSFILLACLLAACGSTTTTTNTSPTTAVGTPVAKIGNLEISIPFARPTNQMNGGLGMGGMSDMGPMSAAYLTIRNTGSEVDTLLSATTEVAGLVETHETIIENDVARMLARPEGFNIPAQGEFALRPGGPHIMLMELKQPLVAGERLRLRLRFAKAGELEVTVPIQEQP